MRKVAIIQARLTSTRLPAKVLADIVGKPMLHHVVTRVQAVPALDLVVVATSDEPADDPIADFCAEGGIACFRGSKDDVLDRYYQAAQQYRADVVLRVTADCPLIDPAVIAEVLDAYQQGGYDYVTNTMPGTYPDGLDVEVFSLAALEQAWREARWQSDREHVTPYIRNHPELFRLGNVAYTDDLSGLRWTVDQAQDLEFVRAVYGCLTGQSFGMADVLEVLKEHPEFMRINVGIERNEGYQKSLREDRLTQART